MRRDYPNSPVNYLDAVCNNGYAPTIMIPVCGVPVSRIISMLHAKLRALEIAYAMVRLWSVLRTAPRFEAAAITVQYLLCMQHLYKVGCMQPCPSRDMFAFSVSSVQEFNTTTTKAKLDIDFKPPKAQRFTQTRALLRTSSKCER